MSRRTGVRFVGEINAASSGVVRDAEAVQETDVS